MKVLFLDIDGVLNSRRTAACVGYPGTIDELIPKLDPVALGLVRRLCEQGVKVVWSTAWRLDYTPEQLSEALDLPGIARTPSLLGSRGDEIAKWLTRNAGVDLWAIVDDDGDMLPDQQPRFVHTDGANGLSWQDYIRLCTLLEVQPFLNTARERNWNGGIVTIKWDEPA